MILSPRSEETNPELLGGLNSVLPVGYGYEFYQQQSNYLYQRQLSTRKKRNVSGEEAN
jgi:hypothetical protein